MPKDARLVVSIIGIWNPDCFLRVFKPTTTNPLLVQKLPMPKKTKAKPRAKPIVARSAPPKRVSTRPNHPSRATGGAAADVKAKLIAKANRTK